MSTTVEERSTTQLANDVVGLVEKRLGLGSRDLLAVVEGLDLVDEGVQLVGGCLFVAALKLGEGAVEFGHQGVRLALVECFAGAELLDLCFDGLNMFTWRCGWLGDRPEHGVPFSARGGTSTDDLALLVDGGDIAVVPAKGGKVCSHPVLPTKPLCTFSAEVCAGLKVRAIPRSADHYPDLTVYDDVPDTRQPDLP